MWTRRRFNSGIGLAAASTTLSGGRVSVLAEMAKSAGSSEVSYSVMLWTLNKVGGFERRLETVAAAGYTQVELVDEFSEWDEPTFRRMLAKMQALGISVDAIAGPKVGFSDPAGGDHFLEQLENRCVMAEQLGCRCVILLSGSRIEGVEPARQHDASIHTLTRSTELLSKRGLTGVIEPIDRLENPRIYMDGVEEAFALAKSVSSPQVKVLYDLYHEQRGYGNLIQKLEDNSNLVGLVHVADVPGRHQPGTGEMNYCNIYRKLAHLHYKGAIAMEFYPTSDPVLILREAKHEAVRCFASESRA